MGTFPGFAHVAVTVTEMAASVPWYTRLFGTDPVLDEDTGPFRHVVFGLDGGALFGLHVFPDGDWSGGFDPVDHHVSAILGKLGVRTRGEAARAAARLETTEPA